MNYIKGTFEKRDYRNNLFKNTPNSFVFLEKIEKSDLFISVAKKEKISLKDKQIIPQKTHYYLKNLLQEIHEFIKINPNFKTSLVPIQLKKNMPELIKKMSLLSKPVQVGPMAGIAGAIAESIGEYLNQYFSDVIIENGGDIYSNCTSEKIIKIFSGKSFFSNKIALKIPPQKTGISTSSATIGPSLSFGKTDSATVVSPSPILADLAATALGNKVQQEKDIENALEWLLSLDGISGGIITIGDKIGIKGDIQIITL